MRLHPILGAIALAVALASPAAAETSPPSDAFIAKATELAQWIDENSDFGPMTSHPAYIFLSREGMQYAYYQGDGRSPPDDPIVSIEAFYFDGFLFLQPDASDTTLLHELVHHLQYLEGRDYDCLGDSEKVAYDLAAKFNESRGIEDTIDPALYAFVTSC